MARQTGGPQYQLIAHTLMKRVRDGEHAIGSLLPTERALGEKFGVSRITIRAALAELERRGMVSRRPGVGTRVEATGERNNFVVVSDSIDALAKVSTGRRFKSYGIETFDAGAGPDDGMRMPPDEGYTRVPGVRLSSSGRPVHLSAVYVPRSRSHLLEALEGTDESIVDFISKRVGEIAEVRHEFDAVAPTRLEAEVMGRDVDTPCLRNRTWFHAADGSLVVAVLGLFPAGPWAMGAVLRRGDRAAPPVSDAVQAPTAAAVANKS